MARRPNSLKAKLTDGIQSKLNSRGSKPAPEDDDGGWEGEDDPDLFDQDEEDVPEEIDPYDNNFPHIALQDGERPTSRIEEDNDDPVTLDGNFDDIDWNEAASRKAIALRSWSADFNEDEYFDEDNDNENDDYNQSETEGESNGGEITANYIIRSLDGLRRDIISLKRGHRERIYDQLALAFEIGCDANKLQVDDWDKFQNRRRVSRFCLKPPNLYRGYEIVAFCVRYAFYGPTLRQRQRASKFAAAAEQLAFCSRKPGAVLDVLREKGVERLARECALRRRTLKSGLCRRSQQTADEAPGTSELASAGDEPAIDTQKEGGPAFEVTVAETDGLSCQGPATGESGPSDPSAAGCVEVFMPEKIMARVRRLCPGDEVQITVYMTEEGSLRASGIARAH